MFVPNIELDINKLKEIVFRNLYRLEPNLATHQRYVDKEPYLVELRNQFPFLGNLYNIYNTRWDYVTPVHIDSNRCCALNIPIENVEGSYTVYYKLNTELVSNLIPDRAYNIVKSENTEAFRFTLEQPTIINTKIPHNIIHNTTKANRIVMSWSIDLPYEELVSML